MSPVLPAPRDVAERLTAVEAEGRRVVLAPGLSYADGAGVDVMRGEETEIFGVADAGGRIIVLPGSHSKWAKIEGERVVAFKTFITGELFAALRDHTVAGAFAERRPPKSPDRRSRSESSAARRRRAARRSPACSASCSARARCR